MYLRKLIIEDIRALSNISMEFEKGKENGWHVILGSNGAGKSSLIKSFALLAMGEREAYAARQDFNLWIKNDKNQSSISGVFSMDIDYDFMSGVGQPPSKPINGHVVISRDEDSFSRTVETRFSGERIQRTVWGGGEGWFCASFGPFRRFTGGDRDYEKLFVTNKRLAPHLTALGEEVALTDAKTWLTSLSNRALQEERKNSKSSARLILELVTDFLNKSTFLAHGATIAEVTDTTIYVTDGNGVKIEISELSDGYRCALSLVIELLRQMFEIYSFESMQKAMTKTPGTVQVSGVVAIDEIDTHLHPTWQRDIGAWLRRSFPRLQFIVTTHSPIVCRAVANEDGSLAGTVWKLPSPGSSDTFRQISGFELDQLVYGDVLDAFSTELFGQHVIRSQAGDNKLERLAELNTKSLKKSLSVEETSERKELRKTFPANAGMLKD